MKFGSRIGGFLKVRLKKIEAITKSHYCDYCKEDRAMSGVWLRFNHLCCTGCGNRVKTSVNKSLRYPSFEDLVGLVPHGQWSEFESRLFAPGHQQGNEYMYIVGRLLLPDTPWTIRVKDEEVGVVPIVEADIVRCKADFEKAHHDLIKLLEPHVESIEIAFGVFTSWA